MATRRLPVQELTPQDQEVWGTPIGQTQLPVVSDEDPPAPQTAEDRIAAMLETADGDGRAAVKLYRITDTNAWEWCRDYTPQEFEEGGLESIRREWGPGTYSLRLYGVTPSGKAGKPGYGLRGSTQVTIAHRQTDAVAPQGGGSNDLARVLEVVQQQNQAFQERMAALLADRPDPMAQMTQMLTMMKLMREATGLGEAQPKSAISEIVAAMKELRGAASELLPDAKSEREPTDLLGMVPDIVGLLKDAMAKQPVQAAPMVAPVQLPPMLASTPARVDAAQRNDTMTAQSITPPPATPETEESMKLALIVQLRGELKKLVAMADAGVPVGAGAEAIYEHCPYELLDHLDSENWWEVLCMFDASVKPHQQWFTEARKLVLEFLAEDSESIEGSETVDSATQSKKQG